MKKKRKTKKRVFLKIFLILAIIYVMIQPSNDRDWTDDQKILSNAEIEGDLVSIYNIRNLDYRSAEDYDLNYYDKTFDLNQIETVDFLLSTFSDWQGPAHAFLSFGFNTGKGMEYVSISVEARKEKGEDYSPFVGLFKQYELSYVVADENDVVKLRTNYRKDPVYLFPIETNKENIQKVFLLMINRLNGLYESPEFYNTLTNACTTNLVDHVNEIVPGRIPWSYKIVIPGYSYELAYELGLIDTEYSYEEFAEKYIINDLAMQYADSEDFSEMIRQNLK